MFPKLILRHTLYLEIIMLIVVLILIAMVVILWMTRVYVFRRVVVDVTSCSYIASAFFRRYNTSNYIECQKLIFDLCILRKIYLEDFCILT